MSYSQCGNRDQNSQTVLGRKHSFRLEERFREMEGNLWWKEKPRKSAGSYDAMKNFLMDRATESSEMISAARNKSTRPLH